MSIQHLNINSAWEVGFETHNAILDKTPYAPEILFLGTFNPGTGNANFSDFFYGRNYFWTGFENYFTHNKIILSNRRMSTRGRKPGAILNPSIVEILALCTKLKLCFADLILAVLHRKDTRYEILNNDHIIHEGKEYNLIQDSKKTETRNSKKRVVLGLEQLDQLSQVLWNVNNIISHIEKTPSINTIYFTRQPVGIWGDKIKQISAHPCMKGRKLVSIYTPSAQRLDGKPRMNALLRHWIYNRLPPYGTLDNDWLRRHGVILDRFL